MSGLDIILCIFGEIIKVRMAGKIFYARENYIGELASQFIWYSGEVTPHNSSRVFGAHLNFILHVRNSGEFPLHFQSKWRTCPTNILRWKSFFYFWEKCWPPKILNFFAVNDFIWIITLKLHTKMSKHYNRTQFYAKFWRLSWLAKLPHTTIFRLGAIRHAILFILSFIENILTCLNIDKGCEGAMVQLFTMKDSANKVIWNDMSENVAKLPHTTVQHLNHMSWSFTCPLYSR